MSGFRVFLGNTSSSLCHVSCVMCHESHVRCHMSSSKHLNGQTVRAGELKFWQDVQLPQLFTCHVSCVLYHVSQITCHGSHVTCPLHVIFHGQTRRARELKFWRKVHIPHPVTCHVSCFMFYVSRVTCHKSNVMCHMSSSKHLWHMTSDTWHMTWDQKYSELRTSDRFDDPLAYPGFGLGENMIFPKYELNLYFLVEQNF